MVPAIFNPTDDMDIAQHRARIRAQIEHTEQVNDERRRTTSAGSPPEEPNPEAGAEADLPPLPPFLPRPEYATAPNLISKNLPEINFYLACVKGLLHEVATYVETHNPPQAVQQYGLEQASFANQPSVARYLLDKRATLHGNVFVRSQLEEDQSKSRVLSIFHPPPKDAATPAQETAAAYINPQLLQQSGNAPPRQHPQGSVTTGPDERDLSDLLQIFLDAGWHPNQAFLYPTEDTPYVAFVYCHNFLQTPVLGLLLAHGADPNLGEPFSTAHIHSRGVDPYTIPPELAAPLPEAAMKAVNRHRNRALKLAVKTWDPTIVHVLVSHGADVVGAKPLHQIVQDCKLRIRGPPAHPVPFEVRRPVAEYILALDGVDINWKDQILCSHDMEIATLYQFFYRNYTAYEYAYNREDWDFAEWLLDRGAEVWMSDREAARGRIRENRGRTWRFPVPSGSTDAD